MDIKDGFHVLIFVTVFFGLNILCSYLRNSSKKKHPPVVPGYPIIGNLLQLREKKPYLTFTHWAKIHGPIYTIWTGSTPLVVLNSTQLAMEAMVANYMSISTRKLTYALDILTRHKTMVAMSDYGYYHSMVKQLLLKNLMGTQAQKQKRSVELREAMLQNIVANILLMSMSSEFVNLREAFVKELFAFALKQVVGRDIEGIYVREMGKMISKEEMFQILVSEPMKGAIEVDWRDFFPYMKWIPNKSIEKKIDTIEKRRTSVIKALIEEEKRFLAEGKEVNCYLDILLNEAPHLTDEQLEMSIWEPIIESSDTTLVTVEWAMFELSKHPHCQEKLYEEVQRVCEGESITEEHLPKLAYLNAIFHETLRKHPPVPILPLRYVHQDVIIGGFHISKGNQIAINIYGCHYNEKEWENPHEWRPERFEKELRQKGDVLDISRTMAFGAGKRFCAGTMQAATIACTTIARFVQKFKWELAPGEEDSVETISLTTHKLNPLKAIVRPRT